MTIGLVNAAAQAEDPAERRIYGVAAAQVIDNLDESRQGRVKLHLPWMPEIEPWARVAVPMAGPEQGFFAIPQVEDEVLVVFNFGDVRETYVIGSLWNGQDQSPAAEAQDAVHKRILRTPKGHEIELDDAKKTIVITSISDHKVTIDPAKIELETAEGRAKVTLNKEQSAITIEAAQSLLIKAPRITLQGETIRLEGSSSLHLLGGNLGELQANLVKINS